MPKNNHTYIIATLAIVITATAILLTNRQDAPAPTPTEQTEYTSNGIIYSSKVEAGEITIHTPAPGTEIELPLEITGEASRFWFAEDGLTLSLEDIQGLEVAERAKAVATGEPDEQGLVPFKGTITLGEHTIHPNGYVVISGTEGRYVRVPVDF